MSKSKVAISSKYQNQPLKDWKRRTSSSNSLNETLNDFLPSTAGAFISLLENQVTLHKGHFLSMAKTTVSTGHVFQVASFAKLRSSTWPAPLFPPSSGGTEHPPSNSAFKGWKGVFFGVSNASFCCKQVSVLSLVFANNSKHLSLWKSEWHHLLSQRSQLLCSTF